MRYIYTFALYELFTFVVRWVLFHSGQEIPSWFLVRYAKKDVFVPSISTVVKTFRINNRFWFVWAEDATAAKVLDIFVPEICFCRLIHTFDKRVNSLFILVNFACPSVWSKLSKQLRRSFVVLRNDSQCDAWVTKLYIRYQQNNFCLLLCYLFNLRERKNWQFWHD